MNIAVESIRVGVVLCTTRFSLELEHQHQVTHMSYLLLTMPDQSNCNPKLQFTPQVYSLAEQNRFYKKAAGFCLRAVAKHSPELAQAVIDSGALDSLVTCLEEFDPGVKEAAAWCLGYMAGHNTELARQVVDAGKGATAGSQAGGQVSRLITSCCVMTGLP